MLISHIHRSAAVAAASLLILPLACACLCSCAPQGNLEGGDSPRADAAPLAVLIGALEDRDPVVQADAARLLGDLRAREAIGPLVKYVTADPRYSKTAGLDALARIGDPAVCPRIRSLANEPLVPEDAPWYGRASVRLAAALALLSLGDDSGVPYVRDIMVSDANDPNWEAGDWALYTWFAPTVLALPDATPAAPKLKQGITFDRLFPKTKRDPGQIVNITKSLGLLNTEQSLGKLVELLGFHSRFVRAAAAVNLLKASPTPDHLAAVAKLAESDPTEIVRVKAAMALALAGEDRYIPNLVKAARSAEGNLDRAAAVEALGLLGNRGSVPLLLSLLRHADPFVRLSAVEALDRLGGGEIVAAEVARCRLDENARVRLYAAKFQASRSASAPKAVDESKALKVGVGAADITPPQPLLLTPTGMGHAQPTRGVLEPLSARALAFQAGGQLAFVITADQLFTNRDAEDVVAQAVAKQIGCDPPAVLIGSAHNHSSRAAPGANSGADGNRAAEEARRKVTDGYVQACVSAYKNLRPAEIAASTVWLKEPVGISRRMIMGDGSVRTNWGGAVAVPGEKLYGRGADSRRIDILAIRQPGQVTPFAILTSYASHVHLTGIPYFSTEFAGAARRAIESRVPGATALYANSTAGDITVDSPLPKPAGDANSEEMLRFQKDTLSIVGRRFAEAVVPAIPVVGYTRPGSLSDEADMVTMPAQTQPASRRRPEGPQPPQPSPRSHALLLGHIALAAIPGEMFNEFGDRMHERSPLAHLILLGYGAGTAGYIPPVVGYEQGGYETRGAIAQGTRGLDIVNRLGDILDQLVLTRVQDDGKK